jgi:hypothetical protein
MDSTLRLPSFSSTPTAHAHRLFASALHQPCVEQGAEGVHPICQRQMEVPPIHIPIMDQWMTILVLKITESHSFGDPPILGNPHRYWMTMPQKNNLSKWLPDLAKCCQSSSYHSHAVVSRVWRLTDQWLVPMWWEHFWYDWYWFPGVWVNWSIQIAEDSHDNS